jgi:hypothetical protein
MKIFAHISVVPPKVANESSDVLLALSLVLSPM